MANQITKPEQNQVPATLQDIEGYAKHFVQSGFFTDAGTASKAVVKIQAGKELGIDCFAAMNNIHIISGKTSLSANLLAGMIKKNEKYNYRVTKHDDRICTIEFLEKYSTGGEYEISGVSTFTIEEARSGGLLGNPVWKKYPRNMLFARALSNGAKWHCPDVTMFAAYVEDADDFAVENVDHSGMEDFKSEIKEESKPKVTEKKVEPKQAKKADVIDIKPEDVKVSETKLSVKPEQQANDDINNIFNTFVDIINATDELSHLDNVASAIKSEKSLTSEMKVSLRKMFTEKQKELKDGKQ